jgi:hypothetical protein
MMTNLLDCIRSRASARKSRSSIAAVAFAILIPSLACAQSDFPNRTIKIVVPLPAGAVAP